MLCCGAGIKTCSSGKYGACENVKIENPIIKIVPIQTKPKRNAAVIVAGLCGGGVAASCVKSNAFGTCSGIGTKPAQVEIMVIAR